MRKCEFCGSLKTGRHTNENDGGTIGYEYIIHKDDCMSLSSNETRALIRIEEKLDKLLDTESE